MMMLPSGVNVHIAAGITDRRKGTDGLAMLVEGVPAEDPFSGHLFAFRGRKANLIIPAAEVIDPHEPICAFRLR